MRRILVVLVVGVALVSLGEARQYGDVTIPDNLEAGGESLVLNGAGYRSKFFMKMYLGGLYLKEQNSDAEVIISADETMLMKLHIVSGRVTTDRMIDAIDEGFEKSAEEGMAATVEKIDQFKACFSDEIEEGDIFDIAYVPGEGVKVHKNENLTGTIEGLDFKKAVFGIWLSNKPADKGLKKKMLGLD